MTEKNIKKVSGATIVIPGSHRVSRWKDTHMSYFISDIEIPVGTKVCIQVTNNVWRFGRVCYWIQRKSGFRILIESTKDFLFSDFENKEEKND